MVDVLLHYLIEGARYIRLDAVGFMWKTPGTCCIHLEQTHLLIQLFRAITDVVAPWHGDHHRDQRSASRQHLLLWQR